MRDSIKDILTARVEHLFSEASRLTKEGEACLERAQKIESVLIVLKTEGLFSELQEALDFEEINPTDLGYVNSNGEPPHTAPVGVRPMPENGIFEADIPEYAIDTVVSAPAIKKQKTNRFIQRDLLRVLTKHGGPMQIKKLAKAANSTPRRLSPTLCKMVNGGALLRLSLGTYDIPNRKQKDNLSCAEYVLEQFVDQSPKSVSEIRRQVVNQTEWSEGTVYSSLSRLEKRQKIERISDGVYRRIHFTY